MGTEASIEASGLDASGLRVVTSDGAGSNLVEVFGQVQGGSGVGSGIFTTASAGQLSTVRIGNGARVQALSGQAITDDGGDSDFLVSGSAQVLGAINLGDGSDTLTFDGAAVDQITLFDGGDDLSDADGWIDTLTFANLSATLNGANVVNWENVVIDNATLAFSNGALTTGSLAGTGLFIGNGGVLNADDAFALTGNMDVAAGGLFHGASAGANTYAFSGNVANAGTMSSQGGSVGDVFIIGGNYTGNDGTIRIDTVFGDDNSLTDMLLVNGNTAGSTNVAVNNIGGAGAQTIEGIKIIEVGGASDDTFSLVGDYVHEGEQAVVGGAYAYKLYKGSVSEPDDGDWYLRSQLKSTDPVDPVDPVEPDSPLYQAGVPTYEAYPQALLGLNGVSTLQQRVGNRFWSGNGNRVIAQGADAIQPYAAPEEAGTYAEGNGVWGRIEGAHNKIEPRNSLSESDYRQNIFKLQAGLDGQLGEYTDGSLIGGIFVQYVHGKTKTRSRHGDGEISTDGYGLGGTLTWYGNEGFYVDAQAQATWYNSDLSSTLAGMGLTSGNNGFGYALSIESGKRFAIDQAWSVTPQAQLVYSSVDFDSFTDAFDARVSLDRGNSLQGRLGITLDHENSWANAKGLTDRAHVYGIANLYYEFLDGTKVDVAGTSFASKLDRVWGGIGLGGSYNWDNDKYSIYGEGLINTSLNSFGDSYALGAQAGFRVRW